MKALLITLTTTLITSFGTAYAKQETSVNPRVISQEDGLRAGDQSNKPSDLEMVKHIRREIMKDDTLSVKAKNIKIIVLNNGVTLKGSVDSTNEREAILKHAYVTAPKYKIYNQISVVK